MFTFNFRFLNSYLIITAIIINSSIMFLVITDNTLRIINIVITVIKFNNR